MTTAKKRTVKKLDQGRKVRMNEVTHWALQSRIFPKAYITIAIRSFDYDTTTTKN